MHENDKREVQELEIELKVMQKKVKALEDELSASRKLEAATRKLSCMPISEDKMSSIRVEKEENRAMKKKWVRPPSGYLKMNVDAKNFSGSCPSTAVGAAIWDHKGRKLFYMTFKISGNFSDTMLKVVAMREGLRWAVTLTLPVRKLIVETDCLMLPGQLVSEIEDWSEYSMAVMACRVLLRRFDMVIVKQIRNEANRESPALADSVNFCTSFDPRFDEYPQYYGCSG